VAHPPRNAKTIANEATLAQSILSAQPQATKGGYPARRDGTNLTPGWRVGRVGCVQTSLAGKVALVAGATRGAGRGIAVQLGAAGGGRGIAVQVDHLVPEEVRAESSLDVGLRTLRLAVDTHAITSHFALPLLIKTPGGLVVEVTDGTDEYNATNYRVSFFYDLAKAAVNRMAFALAHELQPYHAAAVSLTPGWLRSEAMLEAYGVTESTWRDATTRSPHFCISESPAFVGRAVAALAQDPNVSRWNGKVVLERAAGEDLRVHGPRRQPARCLEVRGRGSGRRQTRRHGRLSLTPAADQARGPAAVGIQHWRSIPSTSNPLH
jgi:NAD(P)-dependent dehydrogenase (short-subunit alcohol dehydrogenase family)